jgi:ATP-dependent DNA helicase RecQ
MNQIENYIIDKFKHIVEKCAYSQNNKIIVIKGAPKAFTQTFDKNLFDDFSSFNKEVGLPFFNKVWFTKIFVELNMDKRYHLISYAQFSHIIEYIDPGFFKERIILIQDNLRNVFPITNAEFVNTELDENIEKRSEKLPVHHIEQFHLNNQCYYISRDLLVNYHTENVFKDFKELTKSINHVDEIIDISIDPYAIDIFINDNIEKDAFKNNIGVLLPEKKPINIEIIGTLRRLNSFMAVFGGQLIITESEELKDTYIESEETLKILHQYWGQNISFRNISIYKNPNIGSETTQISQGKIVDLIFTEYTNAKQDKPYRDLFLTAPTGAGKSLLFQLPAFNISSKGDVTIVVSPLIALMKNQVQAIIQDRKFEKVAYLNSELSLVERDNLIDLCKIGEIDILYLSPELLLSYDISYFLGNRNLGLLVIDEAHLITTWGRDFRVDYWFLGNHIRKIRKYNGFKFPMVAVTATAIYGGSNDMVFDSIDSLVMQNPHVFIGVVKREDIVFLINNYDKFEKNYNKSKLDQTVQFVEDIVNKTSCKTLVYAPYTSHVRKINDLLKSKGLDIATGYYGALDKDLKHYAFNQFLSGEKQVMISTKAFGMGIDISDIEVVYHHAPSGHLPDYIQEIGRLARDPKLIGYASLNYSEQDKLFSKTLHGMSALKPYQLVEVLKKINSVYKMANSQNLLISADDFAYIFEDANDLDQKVLTALMMIEKDYLARYRFNVLIARPKKLFVKVFARATNAEADRLVQKYGDSIKTIQYPTLESKGYKILIIDLDKIWSIDFANQSFPLVKAKFYNSQLFETLAPTLIPQLRISFSINQSYTLSIKSLEESFEKINSAFASIGNSFFTEEDLMKKFQILFIDPEYTLKIVRFILSNYSGRLIRGNTVEENAFIARKISGNDYKYRLISNLYLREFSNIISKFKVVFDNKSSNEAYRFVTNKDSVSLIYSRLGYFLELFNLGSFEMKGGENPMIFIRINDPRRIEKDSTGFYQNVILKKTLERHFLSNRIFDHFFMRTFSNEERWNFIEDYFLGTDIDQLIENHPGHEALSKVEIIDFLVENTTKKVSPDLSKKIIFKFKQFPEYFGDFLGLELKIDFPGYRFPVKASMVYKDDPILFYKWWIDNPNVVKVSFKEKMELINKVYFQNKKILISEHRRLIEG